MQKERRKPDNFFHQPVLLKETMTFLRILRGRRYIDATVGGGGHAVEILKRGGRVLGIDCDPIALDRLQSICKDPALTLVRGNFAYLRKIAQKAGFSKVAGVLFDLGVSSYQLADPARGFSFGSSFPPDMRMDPSLKTTAADLVNSLKKEELYEIFSKFGEEKHAFRVAEAIICTRALKPIESCRELTEIILGAGGSEKRCFQALRIAVNNELENLKKALPQAVDLLEQGGRLVVISFHSLEDRIVKVFFRRREKGGDFRVLTRKPVCPTEEEIERNPRSRSAKMRVGEKS